MEETGKKPSILMALAVFFVPVSIILYGTAVLKIGAILPLIIATVVACLFGKFFGYSWDELQTGMMESISRVMIAILILIVVGMLIGVWILSGTIPTIIYWGLQLIAPTSFLMTAFLICVIASTATGTSFGTMGTVGVALLGVGQALGYPLPMVVGAIVSGAYFGDKMSPVSDSTNITASVCEVELFPHIASMMWTTIPAAVVSALLYLLLGIQHSAATTTGAIPVILQALSSKFNLSLWTLLPPVLMIIFAYRKMPALPLLILCVAVGALEAWLLQGCGLKEITQSLMSGYASKTGVKQVDVLLSRGGINSVMGTIVLLTAGVAFGGVLEKTRTLEVLLQAIVTWARSTGRLILSVLLAGYIILLGTGSQMVSVIIPGRAFVPVFKNRGIHLRVLSRTCEDGGTIGCPLIPWSVHAFYILGVLGVSAYDFAPYAFLNWIVPLFSIFYGYTGFAIWRTDGTPLRQSPAAGLKA
ncbi:Na+/H+ antiporter NhaC [Sporolituus thermophilus]|uniref:Transporter, NhaC family n=1 Tax=Sporolituus thermophilus DSM 23256 TaxID=1123285 RepID=A0A1G7L010_9FIRM|nr:Na+/H+ antiporter NhaC [Sporolituus thermophilus]SDF42795.1 transporter, NhaC family [Sporolituus thermophilus DSM 23256]